MSKTETQSEAPAVDAWQREDLLSRVARIGLDIDRALHGVVVDGSPVGPGRLQVIAKLAQDSARFRWLLEDHASPAVRVVCNSLCERLPVMSYSAACTDIDAAMAAQAAKNGGAA